MFTKPITKIVFIFLIFITGSANASIILSKLNNDLLLQIDAPVVFTVKSDLSTSRIGFKLPGAIDVSGTGGFHLASDPISEPTIFGTDFFSGSPGVGLLRGGDALEILYFLPKTISLDAGELVTLSVGELTLPNFFNFSIINGLNYREAEVAVLSGISGRAISDPTLTTVPVPTAALMLAPALLGFLGLRRKIKV